MKMPEKHDLLALNFLAAKGTTSGQSAFTAVPYGRYNSGAFTKTVIDATMCAIVASSFVTFSTSPGLSSNLAYITSVFISYIIMTDWFAYQTLRC